MISNNDNEDFDPVEMLSKAFARLLLIIVLIILIGVSACHSQSKNDYIKLIEGHGIEHPDIVYSQMILETGNFRTDITTSWTSSNNAFGFFNGKRYLRYDNLEHCLDGYFAWQKWRCPNCKTKDEYYKCLIKYWSAPNMNDYITKLKQI